MKKIEEVARAIGEAKAEDEPPLQYVLIRGYTAMGYAMPSGAAIDAVNVAARAAIEAMREPTEAMVRAGAAEIARHEKFTDGDPGPMSWTPAEPAAQESWKSMIDAALNEGKE